MRFSRSHLFGFGAAALVAVVAGPTVVAVAHTEPALSATGTPVDAAHRDRTLTLAIARAQATGAPVPVPEKQTDTTDYTANPDGSITATIHNQPVRVRRDGGWVGVDPTLRKAGDGTVQPVATVVDFALSGGGTGPLLTLRDGARALSLTWPTPLPAPVLDGDTASYPEVLPGVDLTLRAGVNGVSQVLVVKTSAAAGNPALARLRLAIAATGLTVGVDAAGNVTATDTAGETVFQAPAATMWDSSGTGLTAREQVSGPASGARVAAVRSTVDAGGITLVPDAALLADSDATYPLFIDPSATGGRTNWVSVWETFPDTKYWNANDVARVGHIRAADNADDHRDHTNRSYFAMNVSGVLGTTVSRAVFRILENHSYSCTARPVQLHRTAGITANTTWNNQPLNTGGRLLDEINVAKGHNSSCPDGNVELDALSGVQEAVANRWGILTFALRAASESGDSLGWKKFANNPILEITYNTTPGTPTALGMTPVVTCASGRPIEQQPHLNSDANNGLVLRATLSDPDGGKGQKVKGQFQYWLGGSSWTYETAFAASGTPYSVTIPKTGLGHGFAYRWRVHAVDETGAIGPWSAWCEFVVDNLAPALPAVTGTGPYTVGAPASFTFTPTAGDTSVVGYRWGLNTGTALPNFTPVNLAGGGAQLTITPTVVGPNTLAVVAVDRAGNEARLDQGYTPFRFFAT